eukprot:713073-Alexandrium_andersonii.AAC.1
MHQHQHQHQRHTPATVRARYAAAPRRRPDTLQRPTAAMRACCVLAAPRRRLAATPRALPPAHRAAMRESC